MPSMYTTLSPWLLDLKNITLSKKILIKSFHINLKKMFLQGVAADGLVPVVDVEKG